MENNFKQLVLRGKANPEDIHDYIDMWHQGNSILEIYEFLGMSRKEYSKFVENEISLSDILNAKTND